MWQEVPSHESVQHTAAAAACVWQRWCASEEETENRCSGSSEVKPPLPKNPQNLAFRVNPNLFHFQKTNLILKQLQFK